MHVILTGMHWRWSVGVWPVFYWLYTWRKTGLDLIKEVAEVTSEAPFILLTGKGNKAIDIEALQAGAVDYPQGRDQYWKLERCIRYSIERLSSMKAIRANERKFRNIFWTFCRCCCFIADEKLTFSDINAEQPDCLVIQLTNCFLWTFSNAPFRRGTGGVDEDVAEQKKCWWSGTGLQQKNDGLKYCIVSLSREESRENLLPGHHSRYHQS